MGDASSTYLRACLCDTYAPYANESEAFGNFNLDIQHWIGTHEDDDFIDQSDTLLLNFFQDPEMIPEMLYPSNCVIQNFVFLVEQK